MKLAIMQPYFLPYLGYFQLIDSVDKFVIYDDVDFIVSGWINRNNIWVNERKHLITVPLQNGRRGVRIHDVQVSCSDSYWKRKLLKKVQLNYCKAPIFDQVFPWFESFLMGHYTSISHMNFSAIEWLCTYLGIKTELISSSSKYSNSELGRADRLADICVQEGSDHYINASGGRQLYDQSMFDPFGIKLSFLEPELMPYKQGNFDFVPGLSILDVLMNNSLEVANEMVRSGGVTD